MTFTLYVNCFSFSWSKLWFFVKRDSKPFNIFTAKEKLNYIFPVLHIIYVFSKVNHAFYEKLMIFTSQSIVCHIQAKTEVFCPLSCRLRSTDYYQYHQPLHVMLSRYFKNNTSLIHTNGFWAITHWKRKYRYLSFMTQKVQIWNLRVNASWMMWDIGIPFIVLKTVELQAQFAQCVISVRLYPKTSIISYFYMESWTTINALHWMVQLETKYKSIRTSKDFWCFSLIPKHLMFPPMCSLVINTHGHTNRTLTIPCISTCL